MEKPQGGIFFLPKKEDWEKFSMALTLCTFKRFPCYKRWKAVRRFSWKRGTLEVSGRWWFITKTPLDSLTHAVMTLADAYNLPTECQSLVPLQPKIDPCHALLPPFIPLIWLLLGPPSPILHRNCVFCRCFRPLSGSLDCSQNFFRSFILPSTVFFFLATRIEKNVPFRV